MNSIAIEMKVTDGCLIQKINVEHLLNDNVVTDVVLKLRQQQALASGPVVIDFQAVADVSGLLIAELLIIQTQLTRQQRSLYLCGVNECVYEILEMFNQLKKFTLCDDQVAALEKALQPA